MKSILAATLLATTAIATPLNLNPDSAATNSTLQVRQPDGAVGEGTVSGIKISIWTDTKCQGKPVVNNAEMLYATNFENQMQSYSLSDDLGEDQILSFLADTDWTATGDKPVDPSLNGSPGACATFAYNADADHTKKGCHSLPNVLGCVVIEVNQAPVSG